MKRFFKSLGFALEGLQTAFSQQANLRIHFFFLVFALFFAWLLGISFTEWLIIILVSGMVFSAELLNSAIEKVVDLASPEIHPLAKQAKDIAAASVLLTALTAIIVGTLVYGKYILQFLSDFL